jgi:GDP-4-dehydro-6-deoxy-D-mannose reductase
MQEGHTVHGLIRGSNGREMDLLDVLTPDELAAIKFSYADLTDYSSMLAIFSEFKFDGVFHLAAQSHPPESFRSTVKTFADNVTGTVHLIDIIQRHQKDCVLMVCSTSEVYGNTGMKVPIIDESMALAPVNPYASSKAAIDLHMQERCQNGFLKGYITRAFSHTGPRRGKNFSISWDAHSLAMMAAGRVKTNVLEVGNLKTRRVVIDVRDTVRAYYMLMLNHDNGEAYNVCGLPDTVSEMEVFTDTLIKISGLKGVTKEVSPRLYRPIDIAVQIGSTEKLRAKTGWAPTIPLNRTLEDLYEYWLRKIKAAATN